MTFTALQYWWWPYLFILVAGWLATDVWRYLGVYFGGRAAENSDVIVFIRCVATALVAAVIGNLVVFPSGALADTSLILRIVAMAAGFVAYLLVQRRIVVGIAAAEVVLFAGLLLG
ncbi:MULTISPECIES: AzlD domain-containing protein [Mesorhizobium]|uniref:AzlD domain-containing protein n=1 Tax=Mesorhizobium denitrificans TaxID=2294114 RepID=A0A371XDE7_9HYPH|nr:MULTISPECIES: AzlD domain-containing protein [Mesorhizobium]RFC67251.1 AzlD domain-containing protein [Mesorhizobium denitrificans]